MNKEMTTEQLLDALHETTPPLHPTKFDVLGLDGVTIETRTPNGWAVCKNGHCFGRDLNSQYEPLPSSRTKSFEEGFRFSFADARDIAARLLASRVTSEPAKKAEPAQGTKSFHLGHVLTITTGAPVSLVDEEYPIGGVYRILNFMTGDNLFTRALPRAAEACKPHLLTQFPHLGEAHVEESLRAALAATKGQSKKFTTGAILQWLGTAAGLYGEFFDVAPLAPGEWLAIDPMQELGAMVGDDKVIVVEIGDDAATP